MVIGIIKTIIKLLLLFPILGLYAQERIKNKENECYFTSAKLAPEVKDIAIVDTFLVSNNDLDFLNVYSEGDYQREYNYVRFFQIKGIWYFESSKRSARPINFELKSDYIAQLLSKEEEHSVYICNSRRLKNTTKYLFSVKGKLVTSLITNNHFENVKIDSSFQLQMNIFNTFISKAIEFN